ncbi:WXG100 family type VII secretion target [Streptacidiphilus sp. P02-A3a]|uniref:WXG100 family type VII secretion target n=1 Tax=Streptacidiphilus sp. P02-A3a TaxID=2704468 RepID=UPI0015FC4604|nr:WXG100 family type VII secretion target [Streptacidiphilus sp. P02-A3a]QMU72834.1 WXG100 family type VII secretion target [Streptacidiphilus sp. P02-A3a]
MKTIGSGADDWSPVTDFENCTHEQLWEMVQGASPTQILLVGDTLAKAGTQIQSLADDLAQHLAGLQWTGTAADAFTGWARQVVSATDTLSIYANNTAVALTMAGTQLGSTIAGMPPVPTADLRTVAEFRKQQLLTAGDPKTVPAGGITQDAATRAQANIQSAYQEALGQMESLGGAYVGAVATMGVSTIPTFPPLPSTLMPPQGSGYADTGADSAARSWPGQGASSPYGDGGLRSGTSPAGSSSSGSPTGAVGRTFVAVQSPLLGTGNSGGGMSTVLQGTHPYEAPAPNTHTAGGGIGGGGTAPGSGAIVPPSLLGMSGSAGYGGGEARGPGTAHGAGGRASTGSGAPAGERDIGISGGTAMPAESGGHFGATAMGVDRGPTSAAYVREIGAIGDVAGIGGSANVPSPTAETGISPEAIPTGSTTDSQHAGEFLPGGMGMGGMGQMGDGSSKRRRRRAAYLVEDGETWTSATSGANPAVIE